MLFSTPRRLIDLLETHISEDSSNPVLKNLKNELDSYSCEDLDRLCQKNYQTRLKSQKQNPFLAIMDYFSELGSFLVSVPLEQERAKIVHKFITLYSKMIKKIISPYSLHKQKIKAQDINAVIGSFRAALCLCCESAFLQMSVTPPEQAIQVEESLDIVFQLFEEIQNIEELDIIDVQLFENLLRVGVRLSEFHFHRNFAETQQIGFYKKLINYIEDAELEQKFLCILATEIVKTANYVASTFQCLKILLLEGSQKCLFRNTLFSYIEQQSHAISSKGDWVKDKKFNAKKIAELIAIVQHQDSKWSRIEVPKIVYLLSSSFHSLRSIGFYILTIWAVTVESKEIRELEFFEDPEVFRPKIFEVLFKKIQDETNSRVITKFIANLIRILDCKFFTDIYYRKTILEYLVALIGDTKTSVRRKALSEIKTAIQIIIHQEKITKIDTLENLQKTFDHKSILTANMHSKLLATKLLTEIIAKVQNALVPLFMEESYTDLTAAISLIQYLEEQGAPNIGLSIKNVMMLLSTSIKEVKNAASQFFHKMIRQTVNAQIPEKIFHEFLRYFLDMNEYHHHQFENIIEDLDPKVRKRLAQLALTWLKSELEKNDKSRNSKFTKEIIVNIELLVLCFVTDPAHNNECTAFFVKRIDSLLHQSHPHFKLDCLQIGAMLKFYAHSKTGQCATRCKGNSVPFVILEQMIESPQRFENIGFVALIEICTRSLFKVEEDPLSLLITLCNACRDDYESTLHLYIPLILAGQICKEQRCEASQLSGSKFSFKLDEETKNYLRKQFLVSYSDMCTELKEIGAMGQYYYNQMLSSQVEKMRKRVNYTEKVKQEFNQMIQIPIQALSQISFMFGFKADHTTQFLSFLADLCFNKYECVSAHNKCMCATLLFDLLHSLRERSVLYKHIGYEDELQILENMRLRIYKSLILVTQEDHPDKYLSGHILVLSLLNILCGRDFADKKVINLLCYGIESSEEDFKEIILMFVKQFNKLQTDFFPHNFGTILNCMALLIKRNLIENIPSMERFIEEIISTVVKQSSHTNLFIQVLTALENSEDKSEKLAALISMKYIKPSVDIYTKLIDNWKIFSTHFEDEMIKEKFIEAVQEMYKRTSIKSKLKEGFGQFVSDLKAGRNPMSRGHDLISKNYHNVKESQFIVDDDDEEEEEEN